MAISFDRQGGTILATIEGRIDGSNAPATLSAMEGEIGDDDSGMVLNCDDLTYISSAGLRVFLLTARIMQRQNGKFAICGMSDSIREVFEISGFDKIVAIHGTQDEALAAVQG